MLRATQSTEDSDHDNRASADTDNTLTRLLEHGRGVIRARPLTAVSGAAMVGFMAGSLTPRLVAQPLALLMLRSLIGRVLGDGDAS